MRSDFENKANADNISPSARDREKDTTFGVTSSQPVRTEATNESEVPTAPLELEPHVRVIRPSRPSLTYERVE